jgi:acetyl/propionyl-CoA carboxylase alpha subunit
MKPRGDAEAIRWEAPPGGVLEGDGGRSRPFLALESGGSVWVWVDGRTYRLAEEPAKRAMGAGGRAARDVPGSPTAPLPGRVERVAVRAGDPVEAGSLLLTISAMKMEHEIRAPRAGRVQEVKVKEGDRVEAGDLLVKIAD